jgi:flagellar protein FlaG
MSIQSSGRLPPATQVDAQAARAQALPQEPQVAGKPAAPAVKAPDPAQMREELRQTLERLNDHMRKQGRSLSFSMDERLNQTIIQVKDANTGEVVRQIPNEAAVRSARSIEDLKGLLHNEKT